jgi:hypothetical protein
MWVRLVVSDQTGEPVTLNTNVISLISPIFHPHERKHLFNDKRTPPSAIDGYYFRIEIPGRARDIYVTRKDQSKITNLYTNLNDIIHPHLLTDDPPIVDNTSKDDPKIITDTVKK